MFHHSPLIDNVHAVIQVMYRHLINGEGNEMIPFWKESLTPVE